MLARNTLDLILLVALDCIYIKVLDYIQSYIIQSYILHYNFSEEKVHTFVYERV